MEKRGCNKSLLAVFLLLRRFSLCDGEVLVTGGGLAASAPAVWFLAIGRDHFLTLPPLQTQPSMWDFLLRYSGHLRGGLRRHLQYW
ncbi:hypothetical protein E2C01_102473 [Portunus trituberculatus]|uniref:Secreted protein n=1 Tax=Portunus trituberculatus TaxID=210409 RepID=A0A5B7KHE6_PORTR|nr:hypothetical protein [Portunus trituberculatus]